MDKSPEKKPLIHILSNQYPLLKDAVNTDGFHRIELDLGCGTGGFSIAYAKAHPDRLMLSADVMLGRLRKLQRAAIRNGAVENLRLLRVEARHLVSIIIPDSFLDRIHILCPDPWPKGKHRANRLLSSNFMTHLNRVLKPGGILHFASDDENYMSAASGLIDSSGLFLRSGRESIEDALAFKTDFEREWLSIGRSVPHASWSAERH